MAGAFMVVRNSSYQSADPDVVRIKGQRPGRIVEVRPDQPFGAGYTQLNDRGEYHFLVFAIIGATVADLQKYVQPHRVPDPTDPDPGALRLEHSRRWEFRHEEMFPGPMPEQSRVTLAGNGLSRFRLRAYGDETSTELGVGSSATDWETALETIPSIQRRQVTVTGPVGGPMHVAFHREPLRGMREANLGVVDIVGRVNPTVERRSFRKGGRLALEKITANADALAYPDNVYTVSTAASSGTETRFQRDRRDRDGRLTREEDVRLRNSSTDIQWSDFKTFLEDLVTGQRETVEL